jgi:hypothetical protein
MIRAVLSERFERRERTSCWGVGPTRKLVGLTKEPPNVHLHRGDLLAHC